MKNYFLIIFVIILFNGCNSVDSRNLCDNEKAFISVQDFYYLAFEPDEPKIKQCHPFLFDTLRSTIQIDSFRTFLFNKGLIDCSGCISLKYLYKQDTVFIPASNIACDGCMVTIFPPKSFHIYLKNDSLRVKDYNSEKDISWIAYKDSLENIFSKSIGDFCRLMEQRKPYISNLDSLNSWSYFNNSYRRVLIIEISDDTEIQFLRKYIDIAYDIYFQQLRAQIKNVYHSKICELSRNEFKAFAKGLFFTINIHKEYQIKYIAPLEAQ
jgi:hypothetical protein